MSESEIGSLYAQVFASFISKCLADECQGDQCPYAMDCHTRWLLLDTGEVRPVPWEGRASEPPWWASWARCPHAYPHTLYSLDVGAGGIAEACRWAFVRGVHQIPEEPDLGRGLSARGSYLLREWSRIKDRPEALSQHIAIEEAKAKRGR